MKVFGGLTAALTGFATALPSPAQTDSKGLEVSLELVDDTNVKATVKNNGQEQLRILKTASILGQAQTDKVHVEGEGTSLSLSAQYLDCLTECIPLITAKLL